MTMTMTMSARPRQRVRTLGAVLVAGGLILAGFAALVILFLAGYTPDEEAAPLPLRTRDELRQQLAGKTRDEVRGVLGRPIDEDAGPDHHWDYRNASRDPAIGRPDLMVHVHFGPDGRVSEVDFDPPEQLAPRPIGE